MSTLITSREVVEFGPVDKHLEPGAITPFIQPVEEALFRTVLGIELYNTLLADKSDLSQYVEFVKGVSYAQASLVIYGDQLWTASQATTGQEIPGISSFWVKAQKFQTEKFNQAWERYLRVIIACLVTTKGAATITIRMASTGTQSSGGATPLEVAGANEEIVQLIRMHLANFHRWQKDNGGLTGYTWQGHKRINRIQPNHGFVGLDNPTGS